MKLTRSEIKLLNDLPQRAGKRQTAFWISMGVVVFYILLRIFGLYPYIEVPFDALMAGFVVYQATRTFGPRHVGDQHADLLRRIANRDAEIVEQLSENRSFQASG